MLNVAQLEMFKQILLALALASITVVLHAAGTVYAVQPLAGISLKNRRRARPAPVMTLTRMVGGLLLLHLVEMSVWAVAFTVFGVFESFEVALYFSLKSYTTVGYGDVLAMQSWRLVGPIEAAVGVLMLGWSTAIIVAVVQRVHEESMELPPQEQKESGEAQKS